MQVVHACKLQAPCREAQEVQSYQSLGLYKDTLGRDCLALRAHLEGRPTPKPMLLYSCDLVTSASAVKTVGQWACTTEGRGNFLHRVRAGDGHAITAIGPVRCQISINACTAST